MREQEELRKKIESERSEIRISRSDSQDQHQANAEMRKIRNRTIENSRSKISKPLIKKDSE